MIITDPITFDQHDFMLSFKELLSSEGGIYQQSMAMVVGGKGHGTILPVDRENPSLLIDGDEYILHPVVIDDNNWMEVWRFGHYTVKEIDSLATVMAYQLYEKILNAL